MTTVNKPSPLVQTSDQQNTKDGRFPPYSVVPRPHPLMRRTSLVNLLGLAHTFATLSLSNVCAIPAKKRHGYSNRDKKNYCYKGSGT